MFNQRDRECPRKSIHLASVIASEYPQRIAQLRFISNTMHREKLIMSLTVTMSSTMFDVETAEVHTNSIICPQHIMHNAPELKILQYICQVDFGKDNK